MLTKDRVAGFGLLELMVALVLSLVVTGALLAFIVSTIRANGETVRSARLSQELRAASELISRDIRRARSVQDPIANVGSGCATANTCNLGNITVSAGCILYGYQGGVGGNFRMVRRSTVGTRGGILIGAGNAALACNSAGTQISSDSVDITALNLTMVGSSRVDLEIEGRLVGDAADIRQTYRTTIYVRSGGA